MSYKIKPTDTILVMCADCQDSIALPYSECPDDCPKCGSDRVQRLLRRPEKANDLPIQA